MIDTEHLRNLPAPVQEDMGSILAMVTGLEKSALATLRDTGHDAFASGNFCTYLLEKLGRRVAASRG